jgi:thimet oligopeptidase
MAEAERRLPLVEQAASGPDSNRFLRDYDDLVMVLSSAYPHLLYSQVLDSADARNAGDACIQSLFAFGSRINLSRPIYEGLKKVYATTSDPVVKQLMRRELLDFEKAGVALNDENRARVQKLNEEIAKIGTAFDRAIADDKSFVKADPGELRGMPADYIEAHKPGADGKVTITMAYTDAIPVMTFSPNRSLRERVLRAFQRRAYPANEANLRALLDKRQELAKLLGKPDYASVELADKMVNTPAKAQAFLAREKAIAQAPARRAIERIHAALRAQDSSVTKVLAWDTGYGSQLVKQADYDFDESEARRYFAFDKVQAGILKLTEDLFGVTIRPWNTPVWAKDVDAFEMVEGDKVIGRFFLDLHPRPGKYTHANAVPLRLGVSGRVIPVAALVTNFPGGDGSEGLMSLNDTTTFLHEFGHLLHILFSGQNQPFVMRSGIRTEFDFGEAPSQMLEEWIYDYDTLSRFATDKDGRPMPRALFDAMTRARYFGTASAELRQVAFANASLRFHQGPAPGNLGEAMRHYYADFSIIPMPEDSQFQDSFAHLNGYGPAYYTYVWSKAVADDLFTRFREKGLRDRETADRYRRMVLQPGGNRPAEILIADFLGRPFSLKAHEEELAKDR